MDLMLLRVGETERANELQMTAVLVMKFGVFVLLLISSIIGDLLDDQIGIQNNH